MSFISVSYNHCCSCKDVTQPRKQASKFTLLGFDGAFATPLKLLRQSLQAEYWWRGISSYLSEQKQAIWKETVSHMWVVNVAPRRSTFGGQSTNQAIPCPTGPLNLSETFLVAVDVSTGFHPSICVFIDIPKAGIWRLVQGNRKDWILVADPAHHRIDIRIFETLAAPEGNLTLQIRPCHCYLLVCRPSSFRVVNLHLQNEHAL